MTHGKIEELLIEYDQLIKMLAHKYHDRNYEFEDTYQELRMEFVKMLQKYDKSKGEITTLFYMYAKRWYLHMLVVNYAQKRIPYSKRISVDKLIHSYDSKTGETNAHDTFDFLESPQPTPDIQDKHDHIREYMVAELKKMNRPALLIGVLVHGKTIEQVCEAYDSPKGTLLSQYSANLQKIKRIMREYLHQQML
jgi:DNA-directed RNA polymerase specialized sigma24 family protein